MCTNSTPHPHTHTPPQKICPQKYLLFLFLKTSPILPPLQPFYSLYLQTSLEGDKSWTPEAFDGHTVWMVWGLDSEMCLGTGANPQSAVRSRVLHVQNRFIAVVHCGTLSWPAEITLWRGRGCSFLESKGPGSAGEDCSDKGGCSTRAGFASSEQTGRLLQEAGSLVVVGTRLTTEPHR